MIFLVCVSIFAVVFSVILKWYLHFHRINKCLETVKGPKTKFLIGNALDFRRSVDILPCFQRYYEEFGGIVKMFIGPEAYLVVSDYKLLELLLTSQKQLNKNKTYTTHLKNWIGTGLLTASAEKWRKHRKIITPAFHFKILEEFVSIFDKKGTILIEKLKEKCTDEGFDIFPIIQLCTLDIICETAMGSSINALEDWDSPFVKNTKLLCNIIVDKSFTPIDQIEFIYRLRSKYRKEMKAVKELHDYSTNVIKKRKEEMKNRKENVNLNTDDGIKSKKVFLDLLLEANEEKNLLTDDEIRQEVDTFMFEGHDTSATALGFSLHVLGEHPDMQDKIVDEIRAIVGEDTDRALVHSDLQELKYMEMFLKEVLRLYSPVPFYAREISEDQPFEGIIIPKYLPILLVPYVLHRNPEYYPDPEKFDPERFSSENQLKRPPYAYLPFSAGPRNCIGQKYAMLEMKMILSKILRHFKVISVGHQPEIAAEIVLKSLNGIVVKLEERIL